MVADMNTRRHFAVPAAALVAVCLALPATASAASPLRGWWPMNERSGQVVHDWSGNRNHGQLGSTPSADDNDPTWIKGIFNFGSALRFDGNDFVTIPDSPALRPQRVTLSTWFRGGASPGPFKYLVAKGADGCEAGSFALYTADSGNPAFYIYDGAAWVRSPGADASVWDGRWHHAAGTYDGTTVRLFIDGREIGSGTPASGAIQYNLPSTAMTFGVYDGSCDLFLVGDIDGVSVWDRALPIGEIGSLVRSIIGR
jgi:concanavalin A-like lectin/glucanase superfamily protein